MIANLNTAEQQRHEEVIREKRDRAARAEKTVQEWLGEHHLNLLLTMLDLGTEAK